VRLASLKVGAEGRGRDGRLVVVSRDLAWCADAAAIAPTLQAALDDWDHCAPLLEGLAEGLEHGAVPRLRFHEREAASPLPRAYQWADGSAYVNHVALARRARGADMPQSFWTDPLLYQGGSDGFLGPRDPIPLGDPDWGLDFEGEVAVITDDVPRGISPEAALDHIRLVMLANDVSLRGLIPGEIAKSFGFFQSKPASAFSPVAVTPDDLAGRFAGGKLSGALEITLNGAPFGAARAERDMTFDFGRLIAHAARTRDLCAGTIIGSGTVSNLGADGGPGAPISEGGVGFGCLAELRAVETLRYGAPRTPFLAPGDQVRIEMRDDRGHALFGAIEQTVIAG
jgi:fumarylacetoacetate (FAA) hydrolase